MKKNYQIILDKILNEVENRNKKLNLLLHCCCAPCSSYVLEYLNKYFDISIYFYNPNITDEDEYIRRKEELKNLILKMPSPNNITFIESEYNPTDFTAISKGLEKEPEGGLRCTKCYRLRLENTAKVAASSGFDYYTTTLSISPHKDAQKLNEIGKELSEKYNVGYLFSDFKKKNGYKRSCELSQIYNLYRQDYCGCIYSKINKDGFI